MQNGTTPILIWWGVFGFLIAYAIHTARRGAALRRVVITAARVFANFGGVPLAFLFIATLSTTGVVTGWISDLFHVSIQLALGLGGLDQGGHARVAAGGQVRDRGPVD